jgi:hypothetical protein
MPLRVLPISLPPMSRETIGSYLHRLADANHITSTAIAQLLGISRRYRRGDDDPTGWTPQTLTALATLTGRPGIALAQALSALRPLALDAAPTATTTSTTSCVVCQHCAASKGIPGIVIQSAASHELLCLRHQRWLHGPEQHALHALPEICTANRRHRRLRRRHDDTTLNTALAQARNLIADWLDAADQRHLHQRWTQRLNQLRHDPAADPYRPSHYRVELATYPETVLLTGLLASPPARTVLPKRETEPPAASALRTIGLSAPANET